MDDHEDCEVVTDMACVAFAKAANHIEVANVAHPEFIAAWKEELLTAVHQVLDVLGEKQ